MFDSTAEKGEGIFELQKVGTNFEYFCPFFRAFRIVERENYTIFELKKVGGNP